MQTPGLCQPQLPRQKVGNLFEGKPGEIILQIAVDSERLANIVGPILPDLFDLTVVLLKERCRVVIINQASDHAGHASVAHQVIQIVSWPLRKQRLLGHLSSDIATIKFLLKKISDFRIPAYNSRIHVSVD